MNYGLVRESCREAIAVYGAVDSVCAEAAGISGSYAIDETLLARLAPYRTSHINRFSDYLLDAAKRSSAN